MLQQFQYTVQYVKGRLNQAADALSRVPSQACVNSLTSTVQVQDVWYDLIKQALAVDNTAAEVYKMLRTGSEDWKDEGGLLWYKDRLFVPQLPHIHQQILQEAHDSPSAGHQGIHRTTAAIKQSFYWPQLSQEVRDYVTLCSDCKHNKPSHQQQTGLLQPLPIPLMPWDQVTLDFITGLPRTSEGYNALVVFTDKLTRQVLLHPTQDTVTAEQTADIFLKVVYRAHGLPKSLHSTHRLMVLQSGPIKLLKTYYVRMLACIRISGLTISILPSLLTMLARSFPSVSGSKSRLSSWLLKLKTGRLSMQTAIGGLSCMPLGILFCCRPGTYLLRLPTSPSVSCFAFEEVPWLSSGSPSTHSHRYWPRIRGGSFAASSNCATLASVPGPLEGLPPFRGNLGTCGSFG